MLALLKKRERESYVMKIKWFFISSPRGLIFFAQFSISDRMSIHADFYITALPHYCDLWSVNFMNVWRNINSRWCFAFFTSLLLRDNNRVEWKIQNCHGFFFSNHHSLMFTAREVNSGFDLWSNGSRRERETIGLQGSSQFLLKNCSRFVNSSSSSRTKKNHSSTLIENRWKKSHVLEIQFVTAWNESHTLGHKFFAP